MFVALTVVLLAVKSVLGVELCVEGFVMDAFCINRGTLLDNPSVVTLEGPDRHSVHCLVDVGVCWCSGFEILLPNPKRSPKYGRAFTLDQAGNDMVIKLARSVGSCSTCQGSGEVKEGFRATIYGNVRKVSNGPDVLAVSSMKASPRLSGTDSDGCKNVATKLNITLYRENNVPLAKLITSTTSTPPPTAPPPPPTTPPSTTTLPTTTEGKSSATSIRSLEAQMFASICVFGCLYLNIICQN